MKIDQFLAHHGVQSNPFADEDAQTDSIFKEHCIATTYHPSWDKIYGDPAEPSTSIIFGEKGSGKTATRLQIVQHLEQYNRAHPRQRVFIVEYDDLNPFLDRFREKLSGRMRREDRLLGEWKLWDHMDAILSLSVTRLVDRVLASGRSSVPVTVPEEGPLDPKPLDRFQKRDVLLLAACYDQSPSENFKRRWHRLRRRLRFFSPSARIDLMIGVLATAAVFGLTAWLRRWDWLQTPWPYALAAAGWGYWAMRAIHWTWNAWGTVRHLRVVNHSVNPLRAVLMKFAAAEIADQPLPNKPRTDDRFELLAKLQGVLDTLGFHGIVVLCDRVDEPHLINGSAERMRALIWPLLDNKFLKHPGIGIKMLLPSELSYFVDREDRDFYQRARLDKQNLIPSLDWTGEALYDVVNARVKACAEPGKSPTLRDLFDEQIDDRRLIDAFRGLRVPRHLFKFMYRLLVAHSSTHTDTVPAWKISGETFESTLAVYRRDQDAFDRGVKAG